jgi:pyruvate dehydrogenase (quinone)/pyruvate oxidase
MARKAADGLVETLMAWGVDTVFGLPGDGINGIMEALRTRQDRIRFVQVRHEEAAAFMACAYAKWTGRLGCCLATSGPGGIHLLNGLYDAKLDGAPVIAVTGLQYHDLVGTRTQQDVELDRLFEDVACYNARVMGAAHVENVVSLACRAALARRGVAHVTIPVDTQEEAVAKDVRSGRNVPHHVSERPSEGGHGPDQAAIARAADVLNAGRRIAILAGRGALGQGALLEQVAERLGAPVIKALLGKAALPDDSPYTTGGIGLLGTRPSQEAMEGCDTLLIVGSCFPYIEFYPKPGQARGVQIDVDPERIGLRYPVELGVVGDCGAVLERLLPLLNHNPDRGFLEAARTGMAEWNALLEERASRTDAPMKPQVLAHALGRLVDPRAIIATDSGTNTTWAARHVPIKGEMMFSLSGTLASMACGLPYAIAAAIAFPDRPTIAFVGDGGFSMLMAEFATCVKYGLDVKVIVVKNNSLGQIKWEQVVFLGNPEFGCDLHPIDFAAFARACGGVGFTITEASQCEDVLRQALATPGPVLVDALVDPHEPPMPPKATLTQAAHMAEALARGTPGAEKILSNLAREMI